MLGSDFKFPSVRRPCYSHGVQQADFPSELILVAIVHVYFGSTLTSPWLSEPQLFRLDNDPMFPTKAFRIAARNVGRGGGIST